MPLPRPLPRQVGAGAGRRELGAAGHSWAASAPASPGSRGWPRLCVCMVDDAMFASRGVKDFHNLLVTFLLVQPGCKPSFCHDAMVSAYLQDVQKFKILEL